MNSFGFFFVVVVRLKEASIVKDIILCASFRGQYITHMMNRVQYLTRPKYPKQYQIINYRISWYRFLIHIFLLQSFILFHCYLLLCSKQIEFKEFDASKITKKRNMLHWRIFQDNKQFDHYFDWVHLLPIYLQALLFFHNITRRTMPPKFLQKLLIAFHWLLPNTHEFEERKKTTNIFRQLWNIMLDIKKTVVWSMPNVGTPKCHRIANQVRKINLKDNNWILQKSQKNLFAQPVKLINRCANGRF